MAIHHKHTYHLLRIFFMCSKLQVLLECKTLKLRMSCKFKLPGEVKSWL